MKDILTIRWKNGRGKMSIDLSHMFPCSQKDLKNILKTISLDFENRAKLIKQLIEFLPRKSKELEESAKESGRTYLAYRERVANLSQMIESGKTAVGLPIDKDEIKNMKYDLRLFKSQMTKNRNNCRKFTADFKKINKNIEFMSSCQGW